MDINGRPIIRAQLTFPQRGRWYAELEYDAGQNSEPVAGTATLTIEDVMLVGTVLEDRGGVHAGRGGAHVVGGAGRLSDDLQARAYGTIPLRVFLQELAKDAGETLAPETPLWGRSLTRWTRPAITMAQALDHVLAALDGAWRVLDDGTIWVGEETWSEVTKRASDVVIDELTGPGIYVLAGESPWVRPGVTFEGSYICHVTYQLSAQGIRGQLYLGEGGGFSETVRALVRDTVRSELLARALYPAKVIKQASNDSLEIQPDGTTIPPLTGVQLKLPWPGCRVTVSGGDRVLVGFEGGDFTQPFAHAVTPGSGQEVILDEGGAGKAVARVDDTVDCGRLYYQPHPTYPGALWYIQPGGTSWINVTGPPVPPTLPAQGVEVDGLIESGNSKVIA